MHAIDGAAISRKIENDVKGRISRNDIKIATVTVQATDESLLFARLKDMACRRVGMRHEIVGIEAGSQKDVEREIESLNADDDIAGINIQLPLPDDIYFEQLIECVSPCKDIEGMHPCNLGGLAFGKEYLVPCTPKAVLTILAHEMVELAGKNVVIVNHSTIIGKPLATLLLNRNATVSVCHVYTQNLIAYTKRAEVLVTATGVKWFIREKHIGPNCIIIDAGIKHEGTAIYGDVHESAASRARAFTPVPGGVGPVTIACMLDNAAKAYENIHK